MSGRKFDKRSMYRAIGVVVVCILANALAPTIVSMSQSLGFALPIVFGLIVLVYSMTCTDSWLDVALTGAIIGAAYSMLDAVMQVPDTFMSVLNSLIAGIQSAF